MRTVYTGHRKVSRRGHILGFEMRLKCDGTRAETRFRLSAKLTSTFKSAAASVQSTTGSRGVRISGSNVGCTMFRASVRVLATHSIRQFPPHFPSRASPCAVTFQLHSPLRVTTILNIKTKEYLIFLNYPISCDWMSWYMSRFCTFRFCDVSFWYT